MAIVSFSAFRVLPVAHSAAAIGADTARPRAAASSRARVWFVMSGSCAVVVVFSSKRLRGGRGNVYALCGFLDWRWCLCFGVSVVVGVAVRLGRLVPRLRWRASEAMTSTLASITRLRQSLFEALS